MAGSDVALDVLRCVETLGGVPTPADALTLCAAATAERSPAAAAALAPRLARVLLDRGGGSGSGGGGVATAGLLPSSQVLEQYEALAAMCLRAGAPSSADAVLEAAEGAGLTPSDASLGALRAALRGRPRRAEVRVVYVT